MPICFAKGKTSASYCRKERVEMAQAEKRPDTVDRIMKWVPRPLMWGIALVGIRFDREIREDLVNNLAENARNTGYDDPWARRVFLVLSSSDRRSAHEAMDRALLHYALDKGSESWRSYRFSGSLNERKN